MKVSEDDRYIFDRFEISYHDAFRWMWDCPEDGCGEYGDFDDRQDAIASARRHDEAAHR